jgi:hypothetical protein
MTESQDQLDLRENRDRLALQAAQLAQLAQYLLFRDRLDLRENQDQLALQAAQLAQLALQEMTESQGQLDLREM